MRDRSALIHPQDALPRVRARWLLVLLLASSLVGLAPHGAAAPSVGGVIQGAGGVSTYYITTGGSYVDGGAFDATFACAGCYVRFTVESGSYQLVQSGAVTTLVPGTYQIDGFAGVIGISMNAPHDFFFEIHGEGRVAPWSP